LEAETFNNRYEFNYEIHPFVLALGSVCLNTARAQFGPIILEPGSFNQDMIVERPKPATNASLDNGPANTGASFFEQGYYTANAGTGLPLAGSTITAASAGDHSYTFAPDYTTNDAVLIDPTVTNATVTNRHPAELQCAFLPGRGGQWRRNDRVHGSPC